MKRFLLGVVLTLVTVAGIGYVVLGDNINIERVEESHNKIVIIDGKVSSSENWNTVLGYRLSIDLKDGTYIGL